MYKLAVRLVAAVLLATVVWWLYPRAEEPESTSGDGAAKIEGDLGLEIDISGDANGTGG